MALSPSLQSSLRLGLTVAVVQGFATLTGLPDITYASLAVLSVTVSTYGETYELGRQRLFGTLVGGLVVLVAYPALQGLPLVVGLPLALLLTRAIAGALRLSVGYSVGCMVVISGWVLHESQLESWIPLRLFWTLFGVLSTLWSLRLFWPALARQRQRQALVDLIGQLQQAWECHRLHHDQPLAPLRRALLEVRAQRTAALRELGSAAQRHPLAQVWQSLDTALEDQILILGEAQRLALPPWQDPAFTSLGHHLSERLVEVQGRLQTWQTLLQAQNLPSAPQPRWQPVDVVRLVDDQAIEQALARLPEETGRQLATRLMLLNRLEQGLRSAEDQWRAALRSGRDG